MTTSLATTIDTHGADSPEVAKYLIKALPDPTVSLTSIPWPEGQAPTPHASVLPGSGPLPKADVLLITYTEAEAYACADVFTPGRHLTEWMEYTHNFADMESEFREGAPALDAKCLGRYWVTDVADQTVVVFKSNCHLAQDGPKFPIVEMFKQIVAEVDPAKVITTGTAGGVGSDECEGDVIVASYVHMNAEKEFADQPWAHDVFPCASVEQVDFDEIADLLAVNAVHIPSNLLNRPVKVWTGGANLCLDFFGFDDAEDYYRLRSYDPKAQSCEMDDAMMGLALQEMESQAQWFCVRNASDPQVPKMATIEDESKWASNIYLKYGYFTSVESLIGCWKIIVG